MAYLHHDCQPGIIHRDVKSTNILLDSDYQTNVADFGFAKILQACSRGDSSIGIVGTRGYITLGFF
jgi:serine/threonine protein kinase